MGGIFDIIASTEFRNTMYGLSEVMSERIYMFSPVVQPMFSLITSVLIFMIVVTRVIAISRWLGSQKS